MRQCTAGNIVYAGVEDRGDIFFCHISGALGFCSAVDDGYRLFSEHAVAKGIEAIREGACIVTDTQMARSGINKKVLARHGGEALCFMSDEDVAARAKETGSTRAAACMEKAAELDKKLIIAVGNAPTALVRLYELIGEGKIKPALIIGVPVGFVNVVQSKELIMQTNIPYIVARGRKGGSNIAACICNALLYMMDQDRGY